MTDLAKPPHGAPCNGCGACCVSQRCPLGLHVFGHGGSCPALEQTGGLAMTCGLVTNPQAYAASVVAKHGRANAAKAAATLIGAGFGCDAQSVDEPPNDAWRAWAKAQLNKQKVEAARSVWQPA